MIVGQLIDHLFGGFAPKAFDDGAAPFFRRQVLPVEFGKHPLCVFAQVDAFHLADFGELLPADDRLCRSLGIVSA